MTITGGPGFDPYHVLGVGRDADAVVIQLAYRARIRDAHPDIAGSAGLERAKLLNIARDWLLDPALRAQLPPPGAAAPPPDRPPGTGRGRPRPQRPRHPSQRGYDSSSFDPFSMDFGPHTPELRAFLRALTTLTPDERARLNYSLGDGRSIDFEEYGDYLDPHLWSMSRALRDAVAMVWEQGVDDAAPVISPLGQLMPAGFLVANAYAQWILLGDFLRQELGAAVFRSEHVLDAFALRCVEPWQASIRQARYGPNEPRVQAFLEVADTLPPDAAERLARSWRKHLGRDAQGNPSDMVGPGIWLPAPPDYPEVLKVSGYLAAVDASRIAPPLELEKQHHSGFRNGLRLSAHVLALGMGGRQGRDYLRPWHDALGQGPSVWSRVRSRIPAG
jgi:hypothetical protein